MEIKYDKSANAICIQFKKGKVSRDVEIHDNVFAGFSRNNELIEIQILDLDSNKSAWITVEAAAKLLEKSERTIIRWIKIGKIRSKKVGREHRINLEEISDLAS